MIYLLIYLIVGCALFWSFSKKIPLTRFNHALLLLIWLVTYPYIVIENIVRFKRHQKEK